MISPLDRIVLPQGALINRKVPLPGGGFEQVGQDDGRLNAMDLFFRMNRGRFTMSVVADLGSNCGHYPFLFRELGAIRVMAMEGRDQFSDVYQSLAARMPNLGEGIDWHRGDIRDLLAEIRKPCDVDIVSMLGLIYHVEKPWDFLSRVSETFAAAHTLCIEGEIGGETEDVTTIEGGPTGDQSKALRAGEECLKPSALSMEDNLIRLGWVPTRIPLPTQLYIGGARGFWICVR